MVVEPCYRGLYTPPVNAIHHQRAGSVVLGRDGASWALSILWPSWCWRDTFRRPSRTDDNPHFSIECYDDFAETLSTLARCAYRIRRHALRMGEVRRAHSQALGWADVLPWLTATHSNSNRKILAWEAAATASCFRMAITPLHYAALIEARIIEEDELDTYGSDDSRLPMSGMATYTM